jgi:hypothetical protein
MALLMLAVDTLRSVRVNEGGTKPGDASLRGAATPSSGHAGATGPLSQTPAAELAPAAFSGRYIAFGEPIAIKTRGNRIKADFGIAGLRMEAAGVTDLGTEYSVHHWLGKIVSGAFPFNLELVRVIVPPVDQGEVADHLWLAVSDVGYEYCPRYSAPSEVPASWLRAAGTYNGCEVTIEDGALLMSGVGYLRETVPGLYEVVGGIFDGETVVRNPESGALSHQGLLYDRR